MYKLILVDDDRAALKNLSIGVEWEKLGFTLAGSFVNASLAKDFIENNHVDVIICDIKMHGMSGVDFAEYVSLNHPYISFVLLSGYESFEYAKKAIRCGVVDYLLKPIMISELEEVLKKIRANLVKKNSSVIQQEEMEIRECITGYFLRKTGDLTAINKVFEMKGISNNILDVPVMFIEVRIGDIKDYLINNWGYGREGLNTAIGNLFMDKSIVAVPLSYHFDSTEFVLFFDCDDIEKCKLIFEHIEKRFVKNAVEILNLDLSIEVKRISKNIYDIFDDVKSEYTMLNVNIVYDFINNGETDKAIEAYKEFEERIKDAPESKNYFMMLLSKRIKESRNYNHYKDEIKQLIDNNSDNISFIESVSKENGRLSVYNYTELAKRYVSEHYSENISASDVAKYVMLSDSWFSKLFKKETGENFIDYLNRTRIEKATELLRTTNYSVNEIYEKVGYKSRNHFYVLFKRYTDCSAQEYRKLFQKGEK